MNDERVIYTIYEEMIQSGAEANLGRKLTEKELKRLACVLIDSPFFDGIYCALIEAAEDAMDNKDGRWNEWDRENKNTPFEKMPYFSYQQPKIGM
jgi:hypothetical protein